MVSGCEEEQEVQQESTCTRMGCLNAVTEMPKKARNNDNAAVFTIKYETQLIFSPSSLTKEPMQANLSLPYQRATLSTRTNDEACRTGPSFDWLAVETELQPAAIPPVRIAVPGK